MKFMYYYFFIIGKWCKRNVNSSGIDRVNINKLRKFKIFIPSLEEQERIVHILDLFCDLKERIIKNFENEKILREKQFRYYRNSIFEKIKKNEKIKWKNLGEVCEILNRRRRPIAKRDRKSGNYPYYGANGIQDFVENYIFDGEFLLVGEDGSVINEDNSPILNFAEGKIWVNNHAHVLCKKRDIKLKYLYYFLQTVDIRKFVKGMPMKFLKGDLLEIKIPIPSMRDQEKTILILEKFDNLCKNILKNLCIEGEYVEKQYEYYKAEFFRKT